MERSRLRAATGMRYASLNPILDELVKEGRIKMNAGLYRNILSPADYLEAMEFLIICAYFGNLEA